MFAAEVFIKEEVPVLHGFSLENKVVQYLWETWFNKF